MFDAINIIYVYLAVVISLILFDLFYVFYDKLIQRRIRHNHIIFKTMIENEIKSKKNHQQNYKIFRKKLVKVYNLIAYDESIDELLKIKKISTLRYLKNNEKLFYYLSMKYKKKDSMYKAYFAYVMKDYFYKKNITDNELIDFMNNLISDKSIYARENAMLFFYNNGNAELVYKSIKKMSDNNIFYSHILLSNDLGKFTGDYDELNELLMSNFDSFSKYFQISIIDYLKYAKNRKYKEIIYNKLISNKYEKDVNIAMIKYFGKVKYEPVVDILLKYLNEKDRTYYNYKLESILALKLYKNAKVKSNLLMSINDNDSYIKKNIAIALSKHKVGKRDLNAINGDNDIKLIYNYTIGKGEKYANN